MPTIISEQTADVIHVTKEETYYISLVGDELTDTGDLRTPKLGLGWRLRLAKSFGKAITVYFEIDGFKLSGNLTVIVAQHAEIGAASAQTLTFPTLHISETEQFQVPSGLVRQVTTSAVSIASFPVFSLRVQRSELSTKSVLPHDKLSTSFMMDFMHNSLSGKPAFVDTKFYVFSRKVSGRVQGPKTVFAHAPILKARSSYFNALLGDSGFSEARLTELKNQLPEYEEAHTEEYDYDSDSDLDTEEASESEVEVSSRGTSPLDIVKVESTEGVNSTIPPGLIGQTVFIKDFAYRTWRALIYFLYTNQIEFMPLTSAGDSSSPRVDYTNEFRKEHPKRPLPCSAKSMYRLAEKLDLEDLQQRALDHIEKQLSEKTVIHEIFSSFTRRYMKVQEMQMEYLLAHYDTLRKGGTFVAKVTQILEDDPDRAIAILPTILNNVKRI